MNNLKRPLPLPTNRVRYFIIMLPVLLGALVCIYFVNKECSSQPILSELLNESKLPLGKFQLGILLFALLISLATFGVLSSERKKFALGLAFWGAVVAVFVTCIGVNLVSGLATWEKKSASFEPYINGVMGLKHTRQYNNSKVHFGVVKSAQEKYNCCGLKSYKDYMSPKMQLYIRILGESGQLPKSCCLSDVDNCNVMILEEESRINRENASVDPIIKVGCSDHIIEITSSCKQVLGFTLFVMHFLSAVALTVTWAFLRHCQNLSFWDFGRVIKQKAKKHSTKNPKD